MCRLCSELLLVQHMQWMYVCYLVLLTIVLYMCIMFSLTQLYYAFYTRMYMHWIGIISIYQGVYLKVLARSHSVPTLQVSASIRLQKHLFVLPCILVDAVIIVMLFIYTRPSNGWSSLSLPVNILVPSPGQLRQRKSHKHCLVPSLGQLGQR